MSGTMIYSSSICGLEMRTHTIHLKNLIEILTKKEVKVICVDKDPEAKKFMFSKTELRGVFPLLFHNDKFIGTYEDVVDLSEQGLLLQQLN
ncbi:hypothetical protein ENUP19_0246G0030 [Entamoeba nuttalli]|uniref:Glutaredoxin n=1 Tax=Entamoeba nuttalli TaxID=412467 RepID=A0ABQ0DQS5_9EUKA